MDCPSLAWTGLQQRRSRCKELEENLDVPLCRLGKEKNLYNLRGRLGKEENLDVTQCRM